MDIKLQRHRLFLLGVGTLIVLGLATAPFVASCRTTVSQGPAQQRAEEQLRTMTRNDVIPADTVLTRFETDFPNSRVAALARLVRARGRIKANDAAAAIELLNSDMFTKQTSIGDYALFLRAKALQQLNRNAEARADYEKLARDYPNSAKAREALLQDAAILNSSGQAAAIPGILKTLAAKNDATALVLTGRAYEQTDDATKALGAYRTLYFHAPASSEAGEAAQAISHLKSSTSPATAEEAIARAQGLFAAHRYNEANSAYADAFLKFPTSATPEAQLKRGTAATLAKMTPDAVAALNSVPASAGASRAEALYYLAQTYAVNRQWDQARGALDELRRSYSQSSWAPRAFVNVGTIAQNAKDTTNASYFFKSAVAAFPGTGEVAQAQFESAWDAHQAKNYAEAARLLMEHLALYVDKNSDNRGKAGYWAARDFERAGKIAEAKTLYQAMQARYDANWYGYLSRQRLDVLKQTANGTAGPAADTNGDMLAKAVANLKTVMVAKDTAGAAEDARIERADALDIAGLDDWAIEELNKASETAANSGRINLAIARIYRSREDNVQALNVLKRTFPDYSQMKPEEMTKEQWDVFYPLAYWNFIKEESKAKNLDPHQVAGLIRQESVFNPKARSGANAFGLMQLLVPTARLTAQKYGVESSNITAESLYEPKLNIQLGTSYLRDQLDKFGRIEYVAAAYNAGPNRVVQWRSTLPLQLDEWAEAVPFKETRGYIQGVVRNTMQYDRLYDENGNFKPSVGTRAVYPASSPAGAPSSDPTIVFRNSDDEEE